MRILVGSSVSFEISVEYLIGKNAQESRSFVTTFMKHKIFFIFGNVTKYYKIHISKKDICINEKFAVLF